MDESCDSVACSTECRPGQTVTRRKPTPLLWPDTTRGEAMLLTTGGASITIEEEQ
jgi:hypothetical protein